MELARRERSGVRHAPDHSRIVGGKLQRPERELPAAAPVGAAQHGLDARVELGDVERLDDVVVRARAQATDALDRTGRAR